jgi:hypothetical protein
VEVWDLKRADAPVVFGALLWELYSRTSRGCTCVRIREELLTVINSCVLNFECNKAPSWNRTYEYVTIHFVLRSKMIWDLRLLLQRIWECRGRYFLFVTLFYLVGVYPCFGGRYRFHFQCSIKPSVPSWRWKRRVPPKSLQRPARLISDTTQITVDINRICFTKLHWKIWHMTYVCNNSSWKHRDFVIWNNIRGIIYCSFIQVSVS